MSWFGASMASGATVSTQDQSGDVADTTSRNQYLKRHLLRSQAYLTDPDKLAIWFHKPKTALVRGDYEMFGAAVTGLWGTVLVAKAVHAAGHITIVHDGDRPSDGFDQCQAAQICRCAMRDLPQGSEAFGLTLALDRVDDHLADAYLCSWRLKR
jgi:hypothetical protein